MELVARNLLFLLQGAYWTLLIALASMFFGFWIGLAAALARLRGPAWLVAVERFYVSAIRGTPVLVQIFIVYYGLPDVGIKFSPLVAAVLSLSINIGAYLSETFRAAIQSIPRGQMEAALSLEMTPAQALRRIIFPQAARVAIPPVGNTFIGMLKETSLVSVITVTELLRSAQLLIAQYYVVMPFYLAIALVYWLMSTGLSSILNAVEKRLSAAY